MKNLILTIIMALAFNLNAEENEQITDEKFCKEYHDLAKTIVETRYQNITIVQILEMVEGNEAAKKLVMLAYDLPRFSVEDNQKEQAIEFANEIYISCIKTRKD